MSERERNKAGLHKEISSIFKGVPIPQNGGHQKLSGTPALERTDHSEHKPPATEPQKLEAPEPDQVTQSLPEAAPEHTDHSERKPPAAEAQKPNVRQPAGNHAQEYAGEPPAAATTKGLQPPASPQIEKPHRPEQPAAKAAQPKKPKAPGYVVHSDNPQGATAPSGNDARQPDGKHAQDRAGKPPAAAMTKSLQPPASPQIEKPHRLEQPAAKAAQTKKPKAPGQMVHSGNAQVVTIKRSLMHRIKDKLFTTEAGGSTTKQKTMVTMMPVLFIILLVFAFRGGVFGKKVRKTNAFGQDNVSNVATADSNNEIDWEIPAPYPTTLRDPMRLGPEENAQIETETETETETRTVPTLIVKGILYSEDSRSAVIGSQIVHEGDQIRGVTVVRINKDSLEFEMNGKKWAQAVQ